MTDNNTLHDRLMILHTQNQPDADFADQLESQLRALATHNPTPARPYGRLALAAASIMMMIVAFATVPPLRSLAQDIIDYFIPSENYDPLENIEAGMYDDVVTVETVAEAEKIAGIDALEWVDGGFDILAITAGEGSVTIAYEQVNHPPDRGNLMIVITGARPETSPVSPEASIEEVTVNGVDGQFVAGAWFGEVPKWEPDHYRQLYWQKDGISYHLMVARPIARTAEQTIAIAEALR